nr:hypothetical protein [Tanacetum cinerariifolium]
METIHDQFDELTEPMAPVHLSTGPAPNFLTPGQISSGLVPNPVPATPYAPPPVKNWRFYFSQWKRQRYPPIEKQLFKLQVTSSDTERTVKVRTTDSQLTNVTDPVTNTQAQNDLLRAENDKVKQHYKELYDSIKITD